MTTKLPTWNQTPATIAALDYIGTHRKTGTYPKRKSCPVSMRIANKLVSIQWAMWIDDAQTKLMLTYQGEQRFAVRHPYSKYAVKDLWVTSRINENAKKNRKSK